MMLRELNEENIFCFLLKQHSENCLNTGIFQDLYKAQVGGRPVRSAEVRSGGQGVHARWDGGLTPGSGGHVPVPCG